jgi:transcriptional regulator with XRE-family HTH domain
MGMLEVQKGRQRSMAEEPLGQRIRQARKRRGWSQERFAEEVGVSYRTVIRWENTGEIPRPDSQQQLRELFGFREQDFQRPPVLREEAASPLEVSASEELPAELSEPVLAGAEPHPTLPPKRLMELFGFEKQDAQSSSLSEGEAVSLPEASVSEEPPTEPSEPDLTSSELEQMLPAKEDFKMYVGRRIYQRAGGPVSKRPYVTVNGRPLPYFDRYKRKQEEERIFEWGFGGEGPSYLARSILADYLGERYPDTRYLDRAESNALLFGNLFKEEMIASLPNEFRDQVNDDWQMTSSQIRTWFYSLEADGITRQTLLKNISGEPN